MIIILPYAGYGTRRKALVCGRVLEDERVRPAVASDRRWRNLLSFIQRMESDEVPHAKLRVAGRPASADGEGHFRAEVPGRFKTGWNPVAIELAGDAAVKATCRVLVPSPTARFGVVSDIDDTVVYSHVTRKLRMLLTVALSNARTRKPFAGVAAFYRALHRGVNPFFYVSKSPWNLYVPLVEMLAHQGLPAGPLLLRDFGWRMEKDHKAEAISAILDTYPKLPFVLIGDSGEKDPEIYAGIVHRYPERIRAVYIRSVSEARIAAVGKLAAEVAKTGCQLVLAPNTEIAAMHAAAEGLIRTADLASIRSDRKADARKKRIGL